MGHVERGREDSKQIALKILFTVSGFALIAFIFLNSAEIGMVSGAKSATVVRILNGIMEWLGIGIRLSELMVRKLAHFAEYALLGFWLTLSLRAYTKRLLPHISWPLFLGLFTAVCDESFQLAIPGRSGVLTDVLIDFGGVLSGIFAGALTILFALRLRRNRKL